MFAFKNYNCILVSNEKMERCLYIDHSCAVDRINCSLVTPLNRQTQSDSWSDVFLLEMFLLGGF